ncbi:MAG: class I SAM-dependent methyltransferase [Thermodesulfobacteriota bacterium]
MKNITDDRKGFFDRHAATWDGELAYHEKSEALREAVRSFELSEGQCVLDVGTGTGILLPLLREAIGRTGCLAAMDFSLQMLRKAEARSAAAMGFRINAGVGLIPLKSDRFDRVTCFSAFPHFPDKKRALQEMARVLRPGGLVCIAHLHSVEEMNRFHQEVGGPVGRDRLPEPQEMERLMKDCGLRDILIENRTGRFLATGRKAS